MRENDSRRAAARLGATTVEMAVVVPVFLLFVFGIVEFGRAVMMKQALTEAARQACRTAALATTRSSDDVKSAAFDAIRSASTETSKFDVQVQPSDLSSVRRGNEITTTVRVSYSDVSWLVPSFLGDVVLSGESTMSRE